MDLVRELIRGQYALTEHHHRSYEAFVAAVPQMIRRRNPILFAPEVEGEPYEVRVWIGGQNGRLDLVRASDGRDTPAEARAGGRTYALQIVADVKIVMRLGARESSRTLRDVAMGEIPLMVRSTRCAYRDGSAPDPEPEDPGGYFVVDGAEKVAVTQLDIAPNVVNFRRPKDGRTLAGAAHTWRVDIQAESFDRENYGVVHFSVWTEDPAQGGRQFLTFDSPVLSSARGHAEIADLFAAYGVESDEDIERLVFPDDRERARMADWLRPTLARRTAFTAAEAQELLSPPSAANAGEDMRREWVLQVLANQELRFRARAVLLAHQVREIALVTNGVLEPPTREHLSQARAYAAGLLFETLFFSVYRDLAQRIRQRIEKEYRELVVRSPQALLGLVSPVNQGAVLRGRDITEAFVQNMKTAFERANDDHSGVVQSLNRLSWLGTLAHLRRLSKPIDRTLNVFEPHLLRLDGGVPGRLCPNHTPDGPNVGYILNLAITATISPGGPPSEAMRALLREAEADGVFVPVARIGAAASDVALDVGRQRHRAVALQPGEQVGFAAGEVENDLAGLALGADPRREIGREDDLVAGLELAGGPREGVPQARLFGLVQGRFDPDRSAPAGEAGRQHLRIVHHQQVAGPQQLRQVAHAAVLEGRADHQQTGRLARRYRVLGDQLRRQREVEVGGPQGGLVGGETAHQLPASIRTSRRRPRHTRSSATSFRKWNGRSSRPAKPGARISNRLPGGIGTSRAPSPERSVLTKNRARPARVTMATKSR
jgi:hypothetical protein